jgi:hypothetical protein
MPSVTKKVTPTKAGATSLPAMSSDERTVTIDVPLSIANDKAKMAKVVDNVLVHLGCRACHSGWDLRFRHIRDLTINAKTLGVTASGSIIAK